MRKLFVLFALFISLTTYALATGIEINNGGGGGPNSDTTAIHYNTADEYLNVSEVSPNSTARVLVEDGVSGAKGWAPVQWWPTGTGMASFDVSGNVGSVQTITNGNELQLLGTNGLTSTASATDQLTFGIDSATTTKINNSNTHITSDGSDHSFIDQNVTTTGTPTLADLTISNLTASQAVLTDGSKQLISRAIGIADTNIMRVDHATAADDDYAKFTADGLEGRSATEVKTDLSIENVENTALSTWAGSTNLTTLGTVTTATINDFGNFVAADEVHKKIFNNTGSTLTKGTPVYISGYNVGQDAAQVTKADADNSAAMPAAYLIEDDISTGASGHGLLAGVISSLDTSAYSVGDELYVSTTAGVLTATKPTATNAKVQKVAIVTRSHATLGRIEVFGAGRENDTPNEANFTGSVTANVLSDGTISITGGNLTGATGVTATNLTGTLQTAAQTNITSVGTIGTGTWQGTAVADTYVANDLTISGGTVDNSIVGGSTAASGTFTALQADTTFTLGMASQDYVYDDRSSAITLQSQGAATAFSYELHTADGDGTDECDLSIYRVGSPADITNRERLRFQAKTTNQFDICTEAAGTGTLRPLVLFTGSNTDQLKLNTDGSINTAGVLTLGGNLDIAGNSIVNTGTLTLPTATDTLVARATTDTLTNKTMDADNNTFSNFSHGAEVDNPSNGVHGVTGDVVGTTDSQTISGKIQIYTTSSSNVTSTNNVTVNFNEGESHSVDLQSAGGDLNLTLSNVVTGNSYLIEFIQGSTARQINTITPSVTWSGGATPNISTTNNATTLVGIHKTAAGTVLGNASDYY